MNQSLDAEHSREKLRQYFGLLLYITRKLMERCLKAPLDPTEHSPSFLSMGSYRNKQFCQWPWGSGFLGTASLTNCLTNSTVTRLSAVSSSCTAACSLLGSSMKEQPEGKQAEQQPLSLPSAELEGSEEGMAVNSLVWPVMSSASREKEICKTEKFAQCWWRLYYDEEICWINILLAKLVCFQILPALLWRYRIILNSRCFFTFSTLKITTLL